MATKSQSKLLKSIEADNAKIPGMSKDEAKEYTKSTAGSKRFKELKKKMDVGCKTK